MAPYVSVVMPIQESQQHVKIFIPIDALTTYEDTNAQWEWSEHLCDAVNTKHAGYGSFRQRANLLFSKCVKIADTTWDMREEHQANFCSMV